jgi:ribonuclease PH
MAKNPNELRPVSLELGVSKHAEGSVLIAAGNTRVLCTASVVEDVPVWKKGKGDGWLTAEYGMLPRATHSRKVRDITRGRPDARGLEIQRLIGRALRQAVDLKALGERTIYVDCDVIQADGGTRTAAVTGGMVALAEALVWTIKRRKLEASPLTAFVAAVSVGIVRGRPTLDLCYDEDSQADVDMNVVMEEGGRFIEVQGTGEKTPFGRDGLDQMLDLAESGIRELLALQKSSLSPDALAVLAPAKNND